MPPPPTMGAGIRGKLKDRASPRGMSEDGGVSVTVTSVCVCAREGRAGVLLGGRPSGHTWRRKVKDAVEGMKENE